MPINLRDRHPFFVTHQEFINEYDGSISDECTDNKSITKVGETFDRLFKKRRIKLDNRTGSQYYFYLVGEDARYSLLELIVFFIHFYSGEYIIDDKNRRMIIEEFTVPIKKRIMDDSLSYSICTENMSFKIELSKVIKIYGYPQYFLVELVDCVVILTCSRKITNSTSKITIIPKSYFPTSQNVNETVLDSKFLFYKGIYYNINIDSNLKIIHGDLPYINDYYKPSWLKVLGLTGIKGFKDLYLIDYRYFSNFGGFEHHKIKSFF